MSNWPTREDCHDGIVWYRGALEFQKILKENSGFWVLDYRMRYLFIMVDVKENLFILKDTLGLPITPDEVTAVIREWKGAKV